MVDAADTGHVVFVGMMGSGKSTVGKRVAKKLERPFIDADDELVARTGRTIPDWFSQDSEAAFRDAETETLRALLARPEPSVLAMGGGVVVRDVNRTLLRDPANTVVWLRAAPKFLADRIAAAAPKAHRPLLTGDVHETIATLDAQRRAHYAEVADVIVDIEPVHRSTDKPKKHLAAIVLDALALGAEPAGEPVGDDPAAEVTAADAIPAEEAANEP